MQRFPMLREKARCAGLHAVGRPAEAARGRARPAARSQADADRRALDRPLADHGAGGVRHPARDLRDKGVTILLIEQNAKQALQSRTTASCWSRARRASRIRRQASWPIRASPSCSSAADCSRRRRRRHERAQKPGRPDRRATSMRSLSPALHEDAFAAAGIRGHYHLMDLDRLPGRAARATCWTRREAAGFAGINVTFPCKEAVMPLLDEMSAGGAADRRRQHRDDRPRAAAPSATTPTASAFAATSRRGLGRASRRGQDGGARRRRRRRARRGVRADGPGCRARPRPRQGHGTRRRRWSPTSMLHYGAARCAAADSLAAGDRAARPASSTPRRSACSAFPATRCRSRPLRRRHWVADVIYTPARDRADQGRAGQGRAGADRRRHVRAPGGRDVPPVHRPHAGCRAHAQRASPRRVAARDAGAAAAA